MKRQITPFHRILLAGPLLLVACNADQVIYPVPVFVSPVVSQQLDFSQWSGCSAAAYCAWHVVTLTNLLTLIIGPKNYTHGRSFFKLPGF